MIFRRSRCFAAALCCAALALLPSLEAQQPAPGHPTSTLFVNPLLPSGADPWVTSRGGFYYYMNTTQDSLQIWKTRSMAELATAEHKVVWRAPQSGPYAHEVWAPELHFLRGRWYIYFAADAGANESHRLYVLENDARDPLEGQWRMRGQLKTPGDRWAIDPSVFESGGRMYLIWSGWAGAMNGQQNIYLAQLENPWTVKGGRVLVSAPSHPWEEVGDLPRPGQVVAMPHVNVNEGPEVLKHAGSIFLVFSASGCWTDYYELGMLQAKEGSDLLKASSWKKYDQPVFWQRPEGHVFAPGHNSFFKSPDGRQDWLLYHANAESGEGCGELRAPHAQPFTWKSDGTPDFGRPVPLSQPIERPSGEVH